MSKTSCFANPPAGDAHFTAARRIANPAKTQARQIPGRSERYGNSRNEVGFEEVLFFTIIPAESLLTTERSLTGRENREMGVKRKRLIVSRQPIFY
ncbi:MAG: hypothetical protein UFJ02_00635 [Prevotella sp.]|nr:hypothetical protein [Prevotella sp.]